MGSQRSTPVNMDMVYSISVPVLYITCKVGVQFIGVGVFPLWRGGANLKFELPAESRGRLTLTICVEFIISAVASPLQENQIVKDKDKVKDSKKDSNSIVSCQSPSFPSPYCTGQYIGLLHKASICSSIWPTPQSTTKCPSCRLQLQYSMYSTYDTVYV